MESGARFGATRFEPATMLISVVLFSTIDRYKYTGYRVRAGAWLTARVWASQEKGGILRYEENCDTHGKEAAVGQEVN